jgi:hypothetical protein
MTEINPVDLTMVDTLEDLLTPCVSGSEAESDASESEEDGEDELDEEVEEEMQGCSPPPDHPAALTKTKSVSKAPKTTGTKAPRKAIALKKSATKKPKKTPVKKTSVKKAPVKRTVRRPYKSWTQEKLVSKKDMAQGRFDLVANRYNRLQTQLQRFTAEMELRDVVVVEDA